MARRLGQLPGPVAPKQTEGEPKKHVWESDWLNHPYGDKTCKVCGVTWAGGGPNSRHTGNIWTDRVQLKADGSKQNMYIYRDAHSKEITSFTELSCPIWVGDANSAAATAKEGVRTVKRAVKGVEHRVDSMEDRMTLLERENAALRAELDTKTIVDTQAMMEFLFNLAQQARASREVEAVEARGVAYEVPKLMVDVIDAITLDIPERERELVRVRPIEDEDED